VQGRAVKGLEDLQLLEKVLCWKRECRIDY
jgi:hypothetical protein